MSDYACPSCGHNRCVVIDSEFCLTNQVKRLRAERDEARAEVERVKLACNTQWADLERIASLCERTADEYPLKAVERTVRELAEANADVITHKEERLRLRSALLQAEKGRDECLRALRKLLLSRDAAWKCGHDWQEAVDEAVSVYEKHGPKGI